MESRTRRRGWPRQTSDHVVSQAAKLQKAAQRPKQRVSPEQDVRRRGSCEGENERQGEAT